VGSQGSVQADVMQRSLYILLSVAAMLRLYCRKSPPIGIRLNRLAYGPQAVFMAMLSP